MRKHQATCTCPAYPFPHRQGGGACHEDKTCPHGQRTPEHPEYDRLEDGCPECARWEAADYHYDLRR